MLLRRLNKGFTHGSIKGRKQLLMNSQIASSVSGTNNVGRPYFTFMDRVKEAVRVPVKHLESYFEPEGKDYESQVPTTENLYGNSAMVFNAYLTHNAVAMNTWHDMDNTYHNQFGTVDNPVLVFTTDSSWRIVICMGPGVEDESHSHEKMFYFLREGPMNRCHLCGQCFKLVRLKNDFSEVNDYYSFMFSSLTHFDISEEDANIPLHTLFGDRPHANLQTSSHTNVYVHVNPDEADHMLVDPAYKLEKLEEGYEKLEAMVAAYKRAEKENITMVTIPTVTSKTTYANWHHIEKAIAKLDRIFVKVEKFHARQFIDPDNHERRENRMISRKRDRWVDNYTYFFGGLSEEEQMYRDYFQTDIEQDPEDEVVEEFMDEVHLADQGEFAFDKYEFIESAVKNDSHQPLMDLVDKKIFKFKYRMNNDSMPTYLRRMDRVVKRQLDRARNRDPAIEANLAELLEKGDREDAFGVSMYRVASGKQVHDSIEANTQAIRNYMFDESLKLYRDYYESDEEEQGFFEYLEELPNRDRIKFIEIFEDHTVPKRDGKGFIKIPKREHNPELSFFSNVALDLIDFKDRVYPLAKDAARLDGTFRYQRMTVDETLETIKTNRDSFNQFLEATGNKPIDFSRSKGLLSSDEFVSGDERSHATNKDNMPGKSKDGNWKATEKSVVHGETHSSTPKDDTRNNDKDHPFTSDEDHEEGSEYTSSEEERHNKTKKKDGSRRN